MLAGDNVGFVRDEANLSVLVVSDEDSKVRSRLVAVPRFHETGLVVLIDLASESLDCTTLHFEGLRDELPVAESEHATNPAAMDMEPAAA